MSLFEYLTVAVSIVLALGLVRLVDGLRSATDRPARYWIHLVYLADVFVMHLLLWWTLWFYQEGVDWNFARFTYVFIGPLILYFLAVTLIADNPSSITSWRDHFYRRQHPFFLVLLVFLAHQSLGPVLLRGVPPNRASWPALAVSVLASLVGVSSRSPRVHSVLVLAISAAFFFVAVAVFFQPPVLR